MDLAIHREQAGLDENLPNSFALYPVRCGEATRQMGKTIVDSHTVLWPA